MNRGEERTGKMQRRDQGKRRGREREREKGERERKRESGEKKQRENLSENMQEKLEMVKERKGEKQRGILRENGRG